MMPVSMQEDGGLVKKVLAQGEGWETPEAGDEVTGGPKTKTGMDASDTCCFTS